MRKFFVIFAFLLFMIPMNRLLAYPPLKQAYPWPREPNWSTVVYPDTLQWNKLNVISFSSFDKVKTLRVKKLEKGIWRNGESEKIK